MLRHNLFIIYRNFKRFKTTFFINLIGLSTGLTSALLIYLWATDEFYVDRFHENHDQTFSSNDETENPGFGIQVTNQTPGPFALAYPRGAIEARGDLQLHQQPSTLHYVN